MENKDRSPDMLFEVKSVLDKEKIPFWLEAGTLMGAIKYKKIMPWDDDIDLGAFEKDFSYKTRKRLAKIFEKKGIILHSYPEKIDFFRNKNDLPVQIHMVYGPNENHFTRRMTDNREKSGRLFYQIFRLSNVSYYGKFRAASSHTNLKTNLFKIITYFPKNIKNRLSKLALAKLAKLKDSGTFYLKIPKNYLSKFKIVNLYGLDFNVSDSYEKYLDIQYGDWHAPPPKDPEKWYWHNYGNWKKIYNGEDLGV